MSVPDEDECKARSHGGAKRLLWLKICIRGNDEALEIPAFQDEGSRDLA